MSEEEEFDNYIEQQIYEDEENNQENVNFTASEKAELLELIDEKIAGLELETAHNLTDNQLQINKLNDIKDKLEC